jgi:hypothetical protein
MARELVVGQDDPCSGPPARAEAARCRHGAQAVWVYLRGVGDEVPLCLERGFQAVKQAVEGVAEFLEFVAGAAAPGLVPDFVLTDVRIPVIHATTAACAVCPSAHGQDSACSPSGLQRRSWPAPLLLRFRDA